MIMVSNVRQLELISYLRIDACSYRCDDIGCARSIHCLQQINGAWNLLTAVEILQSMRIVIINFMQY